MKPEILERFDRATREKFIYLEAELRKCEEEINDIDAKLEALYRLEEEDESYLE